MRPSRRPPGAGGPAGQATAPASRTRPRAWRCVARRWLIALPLALLAAGAAQALVFPADSGVVNVRDHGALGDGRHDDTAALRQALAAARVPQGQVFWPARIVYLPPGIYRVTDTLAQRDAGGRYASALHLMGASADSVTIRLDDAAPGFTQAAAPRAVVFTSSGLLAGSPTAGGKDYLALGEGNDAYGNYIEDLSIDVGAGNPGAIALDFLASNIGAVRHVRLLAATDSGHTGLSMTRKWPGPLLIEDLTVQGFEVGLSARHSEYGITGDGLQFRGQRGVAIRNDGNLLALRHVRIDATSLALQNLSAGGLVAAEDWLVQQSAPGPGWVQNLGGLALRGVRLLPGRPVPPPSHRGQPEQAAAGPAATRPAGLGGAEDGAYLGEQGQPGPAERWQLRALPVPPAWHPAPTQWANVRQFGARPDSDQDDSAAIQKALDSGASVVYFPSGRYRIGRALRVPSQVQRLAGMMSSLQVHAKRDPGFRPEDGMLQVAGAGAPLTIERLAFDHMERGPQLAIDHQGARPLVLRDVIGAGVTTARRGANGGPLFIDNSCCGTLDLAGPQAVQARQLDTEGSGVRIVNRGAPLAILGLKVEHDATAIDNQAPGRTEVFGGLIYQVNAPAVARPAFINHAGANLSLAYVESAYRPESVYQVHALQWQEDGSQQVWRGSQLPARGLGRIVPGLHLPP